MTKKKTAAASMSTRIRRKAFGPDRERKLLMFQCDGGIVCCFCFTIFQGTAKSDQLNRHRVMCKMSKVGIRHRHTDVELDAFVLRQKQHFLLTLLPQTQQEPATTPVTTSHEPDNRPAVRGNTAALKHNNSLFVANSSASGSTYCGSAPPPVMYEIGSLSFDKVDMPKTPPPPPPPPQQQQQQQMNSSIDALEDTIIPPDFHLVPDTICDPYLMGLPPICSLLQGDAGVAEDLYIDFVLSKYKTKYPQFSDTDMLAIKEMIGDVLSVYKLDNSLFSANPFV